MKPTKQKLEQAVEWNRIVATPGTITNPSQRLPHAILGRYRAGETVAALADDYAIPSEQVEWGIRIGFLLEAHDELTARLAEAAKDKLDLGLKVIAYQAERDSLKRQLEPLGCGEGHLRVHWVEAQHTANFHNCDLACKEGYCSLCRREQERDK